MPRNRTGKLVLTRRDKRLKRKANNIYMTTRNLRTLKKAETLRQLKNELEKFRIVIAAGDKMARNRNNELMRVCDYAY